MGSRKESDRSVRINTTITGELAMFLRELKQRGLATSNRHAIILALSTLREQITQQDLRTARLKTLRDAEE